MANEEDIESYLDDEGKELQPENLREDEIREIGTYTRGHVVKALVGSKKDRALSKRILKLNEADKGFMQYLDRQLYGDLKVFFEKLKEKFGENPKFLTLLKTVKVGETEKLRLIISLTDVYEDDFSLFEYVVNLLNREFEFNSYFLGNDKLEDVQKRRVKLKFIHEMNFYSFDREHSERANVILENYPFLFKGDFKNLDQIVGAVSEGHFHYNSDAVNEMLASREIIELVGTDITRLQKILSLIRKRGHLVLEFLKDMSSKIKDSDELFDLWISIILGAAYSSNNLSESSIDELRKIADKVNADVKAYKLLHKSYHLFLGNEDKTEFYYGLLKEDEKAASILMNNRSTYLTGDEYQKKDRLFFDLIKENYEAGELITKFLYKIKEADDPESIKFYFNLARENLEAVKMLFETIGSNYSYSSTSQETERMFKTCFDMVKNDLEAGKIFLNHYYFFQNNERSAKEFFTLVQKYKDVFEIYYNEMFAKLYRPFVIEKEAEYLLDLGQKDPSIFSKLSKYWEVLKKVRSSGISREEIDLLVKLINMSEGGVYMDYPNRIEDSDKILSSGLLRMIEADPDQLFYLMETKDRIFSDHRIMTRIYKAFEKNDDAGKVVFDYISRTKIRGAFAEYCYDLAEEDPEAAKILLINKSWLQCEDDNYLKENCAYTRFIFDLIKKDYGAGYILANSYVNVPEEEMISLYFDLIGKDKDAGKKLSSYVGIIGSNKELALYFWDLLKAGKEELCKKLQKAKDFINFDTDKAKAAEVFFDTIDVYDYKAMEKFYGIYVADGREKALAFIEESKEKAKTLIGPDVPEELRNDDAYMLYVAHVFPEGNYSNYENNLACGDRVEHLSAYTYAKEGYPTQMSGLLGYKLIDGKEENKELLGVYNDRLGRIRRFVASRGPDNEALQKAFEEKVDGIFETEVREEFRAIEGLNIKEKMLILFLNVIVKRAKMEPYRYEIGDLIVEYKYAYHENLEAYIQRTADETARFKDATSKNFNLWRELSVIYGENLKHVLRHDLFEEFEKNSENKDEIEKVYEELMPSTEKFSVTEKQGARFEATLKNERIPADKKLSVISGQALDIFSANVKFKNSDEKNKFIEQVYTIVSECSGAEGFDKEKFFDEAIPRLGRLRSRYMQNVNGKLEDLFSTDINIINAEIAKYEEIVEVEKKETAIGGAKHKEVGKSAKKRKVRSYISKTKETANARMGAYLCISGDSGMWRNPNYFELVLKDEENGKCVGLVMLLNIQANDGKKYLWFGPNPFEGFLGQVSSEQCYRYMYDTVTKFADENDFDGVVVPSQDGQILGGCTNRGGDFPDLIKSTRLRDEKGRLKIVEFGSAHTLGGGYSYSNGALIHEKKVV